MPAMPNIATILKSEVSRLARKQTRAETAPLKKTQTAHRSEIADLKRRLVALEQEVRRLGKAAARRSAAEKAVAAPAAGIRFSSRGLAKNRQRLGLSAEDCGKLIGVSGQSIFHWESGKSRPKSAYLGAIASLRTMGKREALARLAGSDVA
jgi:DNA-binding transcriptional regulator YiaG